MNLTALDENIERLTTEVREAKQECLAFFISIQVGAEELRQLRQEVEDAKAMVCEYSRPGFVSLSEFCSLRDLYQRLKEVHDAMAHHLGWDSQSLAEKLTKHRELLAQLNHCLELARHEAPVLEFRRDYRRSNHPPTH